MQGGNLLSKGRMSSSLANVRASPSLTRRERILSKAISKQCHESAPVFSFSELTLLGRRAGNHELRKALFHSGAEFRKSKEVVVLFQLKALNERTGFRAKAQAGVLPVNCGLRWRGSQGCGCKSLSNASVTLKGMSRRPRGQTVRLLKTLEILSQLFRTAGLLRTSTGSTLVA